MDNLFSRLIEILIALPVILISLSVHELCHGLMAFWLGDSTAKSMGRLSLNPLRHIDPIGFLALLFFHVGWAKPVTVDSRYFKKPKRDMALTALAGPVSNFLLAFIASFLYVILVKLGVRSGLLSSDQVTAYSVLCMMASYLVSINLGLGVFNLIPIPPLDGSKILYAFLPYRVIYRIVPYEKYIQLVLLLALWLGALSGPIQAVVSYLVQLFLQIAQGVIPL